MGHLAYQFIDCKAVAGDRTEPKIDSQPQNGNEKQEPQMRKNVKIKIRYLMFEYLFHRVVNIDVIGCYGSQLMDVS